MNSQTLSPRADLEVSEIALREVLVDSFKQDAKADAMALDRMLAHLVNMNEALSTSSQDDANVAKRLGDFAATATRMASRNPDAAPKLLKLSQALTTASQRLREPESQNRRLT
jgi:glycerol-3-phosphate dehydrogenase